MVVCSLELREASTGRREFGAAYLYDCTVDMEKGTESRDASMGSVAKRSPRYSRKQSKLLGGEEG
ncbi:hypothetical protein C4D60_Mb01t23020 [Musa balbisiana]|uniref:Uncharacterized protein n=1 Tax=Musa balbisiana TaxID=52838 RepID=A0A4S8JQM9_MUSBA|nr:hypothetical protein C4D60_Mb01t23020 [Musa balbisiana]